MSESTVWEQQRGRIRTRKGGWHIGEGVKAGNYSLLEQLLHENTPNDVLFLHVHGYLPDPAISRFIDGVVTCMSYPDARIWCNQIAALAGTSGCHPIVGIGAALMASDSSLYGPGTTEASCAFIAEGRAALAAGQSAADFLAERRRQRRPQTPGYARPIAQGDDRVAEIRTLAARLGLTEGEHVRAGDAIGAAIGGNDGSAMNFMGIVSAFWLDLGLLPRNGELLFSMCIGAGAAACFEEADQAPRGTFLPLRCDDIEYTGVAPREWPNQGEPG